MSQKDRILGGLWGALMGDALGVPVEFRDRATVQADPVMDMRGNGTHRQPPGTWSDDGALTLCTVDSLVQHDFARLPECEVVSTGYVMHTLHASLWCLLTTTSFEECVRRAVNLGGDTDTTGCVAGGLAGVAYGLAEVPKRWIQALPLHDEVESLFGRLADIVPSPS